MPKTTTEVPVGILERAAWYADEFASQFDGDPNPDPETLAVAQRAYDLARALYAAARGEDVDWSAL